MNFFLRAARRLPRRRLDRGYLAGGLTVLVIGSLLLAAIARFHHPVHGFTRFLQLERFWADRALPELRHAPVAVYHHTTGYDGQFYAQLALRPALRDPELHTAIDNAPLRARRPLTGWIAALVGTGNPDRTLHAYAWINVVAWLGFACLLLRLFPPRSLHHIIAWTGLVRSCGVLTSVRYALTDLPARMPATCGFGRRAKRPSNFVVLRTGLKPRACCNLTSLDSCPPT